LKIRLDSKNFDLFKKKQVSKLSFKTSFRWGLAAGEQGKRGVGGEEAWSTKTKMTHKEKKDMGNG